jgi:hypothetical protein
MHDLHLPFSTTMSLIGRRGKVIAANAAQDGGSSLLKNVAKQDVGILGIVRIKKNCAVSPDEDFQ